MNRCVICGKEFQPDPAQDQEAKFCSHSCTLNAWHLPDGVLIDARRLQKSRYVRLAALAHYIRGWWKDRRIWAQWVDWHEQYRLSKEGSEWASPSSPRPPASSS